MTSVDAGLQDRLEQAELVLTDLALVGSRERATIAHPPRGGAEDVVLTLQALTRQARLSLRAAERAEHDARWLQHSAADWQHYLRWLVRTQRELVPHLGQLSETDRHDVTAAWTVAARECEAARRQWGAIAGRSARPATTASVPDPRSPDPRSPEVEPDGRDTLETLVLDGAVYVRVDELADSLRERAGAFSDAAGAASQAHDELGVLVSEVVAAELVARADALDVAGIELATREQPEA